jgi:hypothetical protein
MSTRHYQAPRRFTLNVDDIILTTAPAPVELTPAQEIEALEAAIADEQESLRAYASNARVVAVSQAKIELLKTEIAKWQAAIYAAEAEAFQRVQRARQQEADAMRQLFEIVYHGASYEGEEQAVRS